MQVKDLEKPNHVSFAALIISLVLGLAGCAYFVMQATQLLTLQEQQTAPRMMMEALHQCFRDLEEMETGQRGYLLTAKQEYLLPFSQGKAKLADHLAALDSITTMHMSGKNNRMLATLQELAAKKTKELQRTIDLYDGGHREAALALVNTDLGNETMSQIRMLVTSESNRYLNWQAANEQVVKEHIRSVRKSFFVWIAALTCLIGTAFAHARTAQRAMARMAGQSAREAMHDPLTGLPNRRYLVDWLRHALARSERMSEPLAVCYLDLDGFSDINNRFGHAAGDASLRWAARALTTNLRASDFVARLGGDEFVVIVCGETQEEVERVAQAILATMAKSSPLDSMPAGSISASIGIAISPTHGKSSEMLLAAADAAMYEAKRSGKHTIRVANIRHCATSS